ncbi:MAG: SDR family oxidoreductase [Chlorobiaceae bacterium]|nr:SDR family oxidoreductase [Chlorobiaceae bacterium]NTW75205.1 SDR family oxidoreductase [Chlorobiaceae bacterium]
MKTVVITGSTRGLGLGLAERFLEKGCNVVVNGTRQDSVDRALGRLSAFGGRVHGVAGDVSSKPDVERLYHEAERRFSTVDIWVNNAGIGQPLQKAWELEDGLPERLVGVNLMGVVHGTMVPFRQMQARKSGMIFTMEGHGSNGGIVDGMAMYGTTKSAATYFTKAFAHEARSSGVTIGRLLPGMVVTDLLMETIAGDDPGNARRREIYNLLADDVETVSAFLVDGMLAAKGPSPRIEWLTRSKAISRMLWGRFRKRNVFGAE